MNPQHTEDYKINAVRYYLKHQNLRETCKIFHCKYQSLARWAKHISILNQ